MRIAVSGASGLIGSALVPGLEAAGHDVIRLVRQDPRDAKELGWDPATGTIDADGLAGVEGIVNLSGATISRRWNDESSTLAPTAVPDRSRTPRPRLEIRDPRRPGGYRLGRRAYEIFAACRPNAPEEEQIIAEPQLENFDRETV
jgi:hypothetical protein